MKSQKKTSTVYDKDFDGDSWLGKREKDFSTNLLLTAGGVTSFGGLFPLILGHFDGLFNDVYWLFLIFTIVYFALPLVLFLFWMKFSERIVEPDAHLNIHDGFITTWRKRIQEFPVTYRYWWLILIQLIFVFIYITISLKPGFDYHSGHHAFWALLLLVAPILGVLTYKKRIYPNRKFSNLKVLGGFMLVTILSACYLMDDEDSANGLVQKKDDYNKIGEVDKIISQLGYQEKKSSKLSELFYIKSTVQASLPPHISSPYFIQFTKKDTLYFDKIDSVIIVSNSFLVDSLLYGLSQILLMKEGTWVNSYFQTNKVHRLICSDSLHNINRTFNQQYILNQTSVDHNSIAINELMTRIDNIISYWIRQNTHRFYDACFVNYEGIDLDKSKQIAVHVNKLNSQKIKTWIQVLYMPYCKRKVEEEIERIRTDTTWIWQNISHTGVAVSIACLLILLMFYAELMDLKAFKVWGMVSGSNKNRLEGDNLTEDIENINKKAEHLVYPHTMIFTIIFVLLAAVLTQEEAAEINHSKSYKFNNLPSLSVPKVIQNYSSSDEQNKKLEEVIKELTLAIRSLDFKSNEIDSGIKIEDTDQDLDALKREVKKLNSQVIQLKKIKPKKTK
ncbi:MAG: hypothetical protein ACJAUV_001740 [Flavobacteriales bacterium]|jgi:hypothetical protein